MKGLLWIVMVLVLLGCQEHENSQQADAEPCDGSVENAFAHYFSIRICGTDTLLYLLNPENREDTLQSINVSGETPMLRIAATSTTHVPFLVACGAEASLIGVGYPEYIRYPFVTKGVEDGTIRSIAGGGELNFEVIIDSEPDALLTYPYGTDNFDKYEQAGIRVLSISEYAEHHPLGRAEWVKVFGLLTGNYNRAVAVFDSIETEYMHWKNQSMYRSFRPIVFTGSFFKGRWSAPGGDSFVAAFIHDAGGGYTFADHPGNSNVELDFEVVLQKIAEADFFGKVLYSEEPVDRTHFMVENERFELLEGLDDRHLFYCNTHTTDYFGKGVLEPHLVLRDLHQIFHGSGSDSLNFSYFQPIEP